MLFFPRKLNFVMISCLFARKTQEFAPLLLEKRGARARVLFFPRKLNFVMISCLFARKTQ